MADWQTHGTKTVYQNKWFRVREDDVTNPAGEKTVYGVVELASEVVYVAARDQDGSLWMVQQYRYPIKRASWEFVAGQSEGEDALKAAARELYEEAALEAATLKVVGRIQTDTGFCNTPINVVLAESLRDTGATFDATDGILDARKFSLPEIEAMIVSGEIVCPHTIASFYIVKTHLEKG